LASPLVSRQASTVALANPKVVAMVARAVPVVLLEVEGATEVVAQAIVEWWVEAVALPATPVSSSYSRHVVEHWPHNCRCTGLDQEGIPSVLSASVWFPPQPLAPGQ